MKDKRRYIYFIAVIIILVFQLLSSDTDQSKDLNAVIDGSLTVDFIDIGQGDAILITAPEGTTMLIDAGDNSEEDRMVKYLQDRGIKRLDYVVGTHPHADHIGGLDAVILNFDIGEIYMPKKVHNTKTFEDVLLAVKEKGYKINTAKAGVTFDLGEGVVAQMVAPVSDSYSNMNDYSAVIRVSYGDTSFLFTGDAEKAAEYEMIDGKYPIDATVLKVGHHGSTSSTTKAFLEAVNPDFGVISSKKGNSYGHPHEEIIERLEEANVTYYSTQDVGTIIAVTDGQTINWTTEGSSRYSK